MPFNLKVITNRSNHKQFSTISTYQYLSFIEPCMSSEIPRLWQFLHLLIGFKWVIFYLEEFEYIFTSTAYKMRLCWTNCNRLCSFYCKIADSESSASADIQKHQLIIWICGHATSIFRLRRRKRDNFKRWLFLSLR